MKTVGIIGCGAIGSVLAEAVEKRIVVCDELILYDFDSSRSLKLKNSITFPTTVVNSIDELISRKPSVVVEAASQQAAKEYIGKINDAGLNFIVMSTGALLDLDIDATRVHVPSGAIGGLDAISSAALTKIENVTLTSRKNPQALGKNNKEPELVYEGFAEEAAKKFPREMNVAATLALSVRPSKVKVRVLSDPTVLRTTHEISVNWEFGEMNLRFTNQPHPDNPKTSALAAWSAIRLLKDLLK